MNASPSSPSAPTIVFAHANSFPASTYELLFEQWRAAGYTVKAIGKLGHDPHYPVTTDWPHLVNQLRTFVEQEVGQPAYLVGHSLGGYLSLMLAHRHPAWARGVVLMDSPLLFGWRAASIGLAKRLGQMQRIMPSRIAAQRCHQWPSLSSAREHFLAKKKFAAFHPRVLEDYLQHGTTNAHHGTVRALSFLREIESAIYNTIPHRLVQELTQRPLLCPTAFIGGKRSRELRLVGLAGTKRLLGPQLSWIDGTHLYPFEHPHEAAEQVLHWLRRFKS